MPAEFDKMYSETEAYILSLRELYLAKHLANPLATPTDYDYDVKSYCILCHAAFEELAETVALRLMDRTIENFINRHIISESLVALVHFKASGESYLGKAEDDNKIEIISSFDYIRKILPEIKTKFSKEIFNNHGVSLKYIKQLLMPVAVDVPNDKSLLNSLKSLANERGAYAHKFRDQGVIRKSITPEVAKEYVDDCLKIFEEIREKAKTRVDPTLLINGGATRRNSNSYVLKKIYEFATWLES